MVLAKLRRRPRQPRQQVRRHPPQHRLLRGRNATGSPRAGSGARFSRKFEGQLAEVEIDFRRVLLLKPETFMNLSGRSVAPALRFYKLEPADLAGSASASRPREPAPGASSESARAAPTAVRRGLRDISAQLGTEEYARLRIGIGDRGGPIDAPPTSSSAASAPPNAPSNDDAFDRRHPRPSPSGSAQGTTSPRWNRFVLPP